MKAIVKLILFLTIILGCVIAFLGVKNGLYVQGHMEEWNGDINFEATLTDLYILLIGGGFIGFISFLAFFGLGFAPKGRKSAFWLLVLPGFFGLLIAIVGLYFMTVSYGPNWLERGKYFIVALVTPPILYFLIGIYFRKANKRKKAK